MKEINLPPFYVGQKVVALDSACEIRKGNIYTIAECFKCPDCGDWNVLLLEFPTDDKSYDCCGNDLQCGPYLGGPASKFAPIQENFQEISYSEVVKEEKKLISVN